MSDEDSSKDSTPVSLKASIKSAIQSANRSLASLEEFVDKNVAPPVSKAVEAGSEISSKVLQVYEQRHDYGPHLVAGTTALVGGVVSLRRGKIPGAIVGLMAGGATYAAVYELPLDDVIDSIKKKIPK